MSNELNNILAHHTNGVFEGVAIGGDRYPGSTYTDHVLRYQDDDRVKMIGKTLFIFKFNSNF
jgi:ATP citrate (pro-S)-lyase